MQSDLNQTFSIPLWWSPQLIENVSARASVCMHAQHVNTCTQLWQWNISKFLSQMTWTPKKLGTILRKVLRMRHKK